MKAFLFETIHAIMPTKPKEWQVFYSILSNPTEYSGHFFNIYSARDKKVI